MENRFTFEIIKHIGVLSAVRRDGAHWKKELNIISWNRREPRFDIREWNDDHSKMSKGITLSGDEIRKVFSLLQEAQKAEKEAI